METYQQWVGRLNIIKMIIFNKCIYILNSCQNLSFKTELDSETYDTTQVGDCLYQI